MDKNDPKSLVSEFSETVVNEKTPEPKKSIILVRICWWKSIMSHGMVWV